MAEPQPPLGPEAEEQDARRLRAVLVAVGALFFAATPLVVPFDGFDPTLFPVPQVDPPAQPAGYAFAIWGPIYLWLLAHGAYGLVRRSDIPVWDETRVPMILALAVGTAWLPVAQMSAPWATILIWVMLGGALWALARSQAETDGWLLRAPIALFAGWLTAASWVALALTGAGYGLGPGEVGWAWIALSGALVTGIAVTRLMPPAPFYSAALVWALVAVAVANWGANWALTAASLGGAVMVAAPALAQLRAG